MNFKNKQGETFDKVELTHHFYQCYRAAELRECEVRQTDRRAQIALFADVCWNRKHEGNIGYPLIQLIERNKNN